MLLPKYSGLVGASIPRAVLVAWRWVLLLSSLSCPPVLAGQDVTLLLSEQGGIYREAAQALARELERDPGQWSIRLRNVDTALSADIGQSGVLITFGVRALQYALSAPGDAPLLALLVPGMTFERLMSERPQVGRRRPIYALYLDQPLTRQMRLIRLALPEAKRVGVLAGPTTEGQAGDLRKAGREAGLEVDIRNLREPAQLFSTLNTLAREVDVLLLLPDPLVVGRETLQTLFLQTYRQRLPIVAYSAGLVQAGALMGLYATPSQLGGEAGQWLREISRQGATKPLAYRQPETFSVDVNLNVARSLELRLSSSEDLAARLAAGSTP
jgi:ABC transporter substrate binding protein